jgi:hypothetical protein
VDEHVASGEVDVSADVDQFVRDLDAARKRRRPTRGR